MAADDDDLVRAFAAAQLRDDVGRLDIGMHRRLHREAEAHALAARGHARETRRVFRRDGGGRNPRHAVAIDQHAGVRRPKTLRPDRSDQSRDGACRRGL